MTATAQTQSALPLIPPAWATGPRTGGRRQRWPWTALGVAGAGLLVAAIVAVTVTASSSAVRGDVTSGRGGADTAADGGALLRSYGSLVQRYVDADRTWEADAKTTGVRSAASAEALIRPSVRFADAVDQAERDLVQLSWPAAMRDDVDALEADLATVSGDLRSVGGQRLSSMRQWVSNVRGDAARSTADSDRLMRRLAGTTAARAVDQALRPGTLVACSENQGGVRRCS